MRSSKVALAAAIAFALATAVASAGPAALTLKCTRESHRYRIDECAEFAVTTPEPGVKVELQFFRDRVKPLETCVTVTPARVCFSLGKPGFICCHGRRLDGAGGKMALVGVAFEPERIRPSLPPPDDYDSFWENAFRELDAIPADYVKREIAKGVYAVSCRTVNDKRMYGFLRLPEGPGPYPLRIRVGGGEAFFTEENVIGNVPTSRAELFIHLPPYEPVAKNGKAYHAKWLKEHNLRRFILENLDKEPRDMYFYPCILGGCRLIDFAVKEPSIDRRLVSYAGSSHGGGFGVYYTAFSPHIKAAFCGVPNFGNMSGPSEGRPIGLGDRAFRGVWRKLRYFDAAYCAKRIKVPVFMSVGFIDEAVPPDSIYTIYNELRGPKFMYDRVNHGHGGGPSEYRPTYAAWLDNVLPLSGK